MPSEPRTRPPALRRLAAGIGLLLGLTLVQPIRAELRLSEILPEDRTVLADEDGEHNGWVELHNSGTRPVSLEGFGLSDDPDQPFRWVFPAVTLAADSRLVVFTSGKDRRLRAGSAGDPAAELRPDQVGGLLWWLDAADPTMPTEVADGVAVWRDKSGRRPSDEYPAPLPPDQLAGKVVWLDAMAADSLELSGDAVGRWRDRSGTGNDAVQALADSQPVRGTSEEGLPFLRFDGQDDVLRFSKEVTVRTLVWVGLESPLSGVDDRRPLVGHTSRFDFYRGTGRTVLDAHPGMAAGVLGAAVYLNGIRVNPVTTTLPPGLNVVVIAGTGPAVFDNLADDRDIPGRHWWGDVAELIGFDRTLSATEVLALDRHLRAKWRGLPDRIAPDYSARQPQAGWRPKLVRDPLTGLPAVHFDGFDDRLTFAEIKRAQTFFLVVREDEFATESPRPFLGHSFSSALARGPDRLLLNGGAPATWLEGVLVNPLTTRPPLRRMLLSFLFPSPVPFENLAMEPYFDDLLFQGEVFEIVAFDRLLNPQEHAALSAYLNHRWLLPDRRLHASFSLKQEGEVLLLTAPDGSRVDTVPAVPTRPDTAYGRIGDGETWGWLDRASPGQANSNVGVELGLTPPPLVSPAGGFLRGTNEVELIAPVNSPAGTRIYYTLDGSEPATGGSNLWFDDGLPAGGSLQMFNDFAWTWTRTDPVPVYGAQALRSGTVAGLHQCVLNLAEPVTTGTDGSIHFELWCDPANPPRSVMLQLWSAGSWDHRAYWGEDLIPLGTPQTAGRRRAGDLPDAGRWIRLSISPASLGLTNATISNLAFTLFDGRAAFDALGYAAGDLPEIYERPLALDRSTVIRARAVAPGHLASETVTASFLIEPPGNLPVVSLSTAPEHLFDEAVGIYPAGPERGADGQPRRPNYQRNWERPVHAELFEPDGTRGFSEDCGIKIHGAFSRHWPQRSLRLHFRSRYGPGSLRYPVFPGNPVERFDSLILRNSGNDWNYAYLRDELAHSLAADIGLAHQAWRPAHLFLNGEYWGVQMLREHANDNTIARQNGLLDDALDVIKNEIDVVAGDPATYREFVPLGFNALASPAAQPALAVRVDATNYWNWLGLELFAGNVDWPGNNVLAWRSRQPGQPWRWMLQDCDGGFLPEAVFADPLAEVLKTRPIVGTAGVSLVIMRGLLNEESYRQQFVRRLNDLLNTVWTPNHTLLRLDQLEQVLAPAMDAQIQRWKDSSSPSKPLGSALQSKDQWRLRVGEVRAFLEQRPAVFRENVRSFFQLGQDFTLTVNAAESERLHRLHVATLDFDSGQLPWSGTYFGGLPVEIRVEPRPGFKVAGWSDGASAGASRVVIPEQDLSLTVLLEPDGTDAPELFPRPHVLLTSEYRLQAWPASAPAGTYPASMAFEISPQQDPGLSVPVTGFWTNRYDLGSRSRVSGLDNNGVSFVNTGNPQTEDDYVTGALLSLDSTGTEAIEVTWTGGTVAANLRVYGLRLQWRIGTNGPFADVKTPDGQPVEYLRHPTDGHSVTLGPVQLPPQAEGQPLVQLRWRYYSIPRAGDSGPRAQLRLDDIRVAARAVVTALRCTASRSGNALLLSVTAPAGSGCVLWESQDMVSWTELGFGTADAGGRLNFTVDAGSAHRLYQVRLR